MKFKKLIFLVTGLSLIAPFSQAQSGGFDEIIVTATRKVDAPAIFIEKRGDFLLLDVRVQNDSREGKERVRDLKLTIAGIIEAAKEQSDIELSLVEDGFVRPLTQLAFMDTVRPGNQPDTSFANLKVKTDIPTGDVEAYKLVRKLDDFVESLDAVGRTTITTYENVAVSIINPFQYRKDVRDKVLEEMTSTLERLGPDYAIIPRGLDNQIGWVRSGDLNLKFYMDYSYQIYPETLSVDVSVEDDFN